MSSVVCEAYAEIMAELILLMMTARWMIKAMIIVVMMMEAITCHDDITIML